MGVFGISLLQVGQRLGIFLLIVGLVMSVQREKLPTEKDELEREAIFRRHGREIFLDFQKVELRRVDAEIVFRECSLSRSADDRRQENVSVRDDGV